MTMIPAAMGAFAMACLWIICALRWPKMILIKAVIMTLNRKEKQEVYLYIKHWNKKQPKRLNDGGNESDNDDQSDKQSSCWAFVSDDESVVSPARGQIVTEAPSTVGPTPSHVPSAYCPHTHTTAQGSNAFQRRRRCKDCGKLLEVVVLPQGRKASRSSYENTNEN